MEKFLIIDDEVNFARMARRQVRHPETEILDSTQVTAEQAAQTALACRLVLSDVMGGFNAIDLMEEIELSQVHTRGTEAQDNSTILGIYTSGMPTEVKEALRPYWESGKLSFALDKGKMTEVYTPLQKILTGTRQEIQAALTELEKLSTIF